MLIPFLLVMCVASTLYILHWTTIEQTHPKGKLSLLPEAFSICSSLSMIGTPGNMDSEEILHAGFVDRHLGKTSIIQLP